MNRGLAELREGVEEKKDNHLNLIVNIKSKICRRRKRENKYY